MLVETREQRHLGPGELRDLCTKLELHEADTQLGAAHKASHKQKKQSTKHDLKIPMAREAGDWMARSAVGKFTALIEGS